MQTFFVIFVRHCLGSGVRSSMEELAFLKKLKILVGRVVRRSGGDCLFFRYSWAFSREKALKNESIYFIRLPGECH
jgi:hypothetical protein